MKKTLSLIFAFLFIFLCSCSAKKTNINIQTITNVFTNTNISNTDISTTNIETTAKKEDISITVSFLGDCMMASLKGRNNKGNMNWYLDNYDFTYFFEKAMPFIGKDDFTIANCENVFTDTATTERAKDTSPAFWFRSKSKNANVFSKNSIDAVSIANNHTNDYGSNGKQDTIEALNNANILWGNDDNIIFLEKYGIKIGIIPVCFWSGYYTDGICEKISKINDITDIQIVYFHGGKERLHLPEKWKIEGCRRFVDSGADLVIGAHPHVLQPLEKYNNSYIVYSIGNFCFGGNNKPENRTIIYQHTFTFDENKKLISSKENIIPFYVYTGSTNNWQPAPITNETEKSNVLDFMYQKRNSPF